MPSIFTVPLAFDIKKELGQLDDEAFSLVDFALEQRNDEDLAVITRGPNANGPFARYSYGDVKRHAKYVAHILKNYGNIRKGDKVLLLQYNSWDLVVCYWAVHYLGAVAISAIPEHKYRPYLLRYTNCKAVIAPEHLLPHLQNEITPKTNVKLVYLTDNTGKAVDSGYKKFQYNLDAPESVNEEDKLFSKAVHSAYSIGNDRIRENEYVVKSFQNKIPPGLDEVRISSQILAETSKIKKSDESFWYFTSGTTGKPKGCVHNQIDLAFAGITYGTRVMGCARGKISATDTLMAGPYAMGSNLVFPFMVGGTVIMDHLIDQAVNKPEKIFSAFDKIDLYISIPTNISKIIELLDRPEIARKIANVQIITTAGAAFPPSTFKNFVFKAKRKGIKTVLLDGLGTSELQHIFISNFADDLVSDEGSIGKLVPGYEAVLLNPVPVKDGKTRVGVQGELAVRTINDHITVKYSTERQPIDADYAKKTREVNKTIEGHKFYVTGDIALLKEKNGKQYFYLLGRTSELWNQLANEERGLADYEAISVSNKLMMAGGLLETVVDVNHQLYGPNKVQQALIADVYPIRLDAGAIVYVVAVNDEHWKKFAGQREIIELWNNYLSKKIGSPELKLVFQHKNNIPRTTPPLLKPLKADMKRFIAHHLGKCKNVWELSLIPMTSQ